VVERILQYGAGFLEEEAAQESDPEGRKQPFLEAVLPPRAILVKLLELKKAGLLGPAPRGCRWRGGSPRRTRPRC